MRPVPSVKMGRVFGSSIRFDWVVEVILYSFLLALVMFPLDEYYCYESMQLTKSGSFHLDGSNDGLDCNNCPVCIV